MSITNPKGEAFLKSKMHKQNPPGLTIKSLPGISPGAFLPIAHKGKSGVIRPTYYPSFYPTYCPTFTFAAVIEIELLRKAQQHIS